MKNQEKNEIEQLPYKYRPMGAWAYFAYGILFNLGIIGLIIAIVFAFNNENIARRNFARGMLISAIISAVIIAIVLVVFWDVLTAVISQIPMPS